MLVDQSFIQEIREIIFHSRDNAIRSVNWERTIMYWKIGKRILEEEQQGKERAEYGTYLIKLLSEQLQPEFGSGFGGRQLELMRQFFRTFPIANTLRSQFNWSHYKLLIRISDEHKREYYIAESIKMKVLSDLHCLKIINPSLRENISSIYLLKIKYLKN
ncbi:MAG TPA: DUF1016 N-terminal domain-containing protein [Paludibacter sp.]|nr:DUF1016 N-terminal domain-containing protein [Paludibacter sp.]